MKVGSRETETYELNIVMICLVWLKRASMYRDSITVSAGHPSRRYIDTPSPDNASCAGKQGYRLSTNSNSRRGSLASVTSVSSHPSLSGTTQDSYSSSVCSSRRSSLGCHMEMSYGNTGAAAILESMSTSKQLQWQEHPCYSVSAGQDPMHKPGICSRPLDTASGQVYAGELLAPVACRSDKFHS